MDIGSFLIFSIYIILILIILIYISPVLSALVMILVPILFVLIMPESSIEFFSLKQFSFVEGRVPMYNIHILLIIWSVMIGIIVYTEVIFYVLRDKESESASQRSKIQDFLMKLNIKKR